MSTEFDGDGFSAVSSFFGGTGSASLEETEPRTPSSSSMKHKGRLGVGGKSSSSSLALKSTTENALGGETKKKIMSIGKKRKLDCDDDESTGDNGHDSSDDEEDKGRTSIQERKKVSMKEQHQAPVPIPNKKKKKKKGKKERLAEKQASDAATVVSQDTEEKDSIITKEDDTPTFLPEQPPCITTETSTESEGRIQDHSINSKKKRKKPKVRSRQKNIKKDTRPTSLKPTHLKIGSSDYMGRPMTKETRAFLNLPLESRTERIRRQKLKLGSVEEEGNKVGFDDLGGSDSGGLAIDDLLKETCGQGAGDGGDIPESGQLVGAGGASEGVGQENGSMVKKVKKKKKRDMKKKKTKYKNLK